jgi:hypothetical protein
MTFSQQNEAYKQAWEIHMTKVMADFAPLAAMAIALGVDRENFIKGAKAAYDWWALQSTETRK